MTDDYRLIRVSPEDFNPASFLFHAAWAHFHPGWLRPDDYAKECRCFRTVERERPEREIFSFGLTAIAGQDGWLEYAAAFVPEIESGRFAALIREAGREIGIRRCYFLPSEKNPLVAELIAGMSFRAIDRIVSLTRPASNQVRITIPRPNRPVRISVIDPKNAPLIDSLWQLDRTFPPVWRLSRLGFELALNGANRRTMTRQEESEEPVAFLLASEDDSAIHLSRIAVRPDFRGRGVGTGLIAALIESADPGKTFSVNTYRKNAAAIRMYEKLGFKEEAEAWTLYQSRL